MSIRYFERVIDGDKPITLFRLDVNDLKQAVNEHIWAGDRWKETTRLTEYLFGGSTEIEEVKASEALKNFPDATITREL